MTLVRTNAFSFELPGDWQDESEHAFVSPDGAIVASLVQEPHPDGTLEQVAIGWAHALAETGQCEVLETVEDACGALPAVTTRVFLEDDGLAFLRTTFVANEEDVFGLIVNGPAARRSEIEACGAALVRGLRLRRAR